MSFVIFVFLVFLKARPSGAFLTRSPGKAEMDGGGKQEEKGMTKIEQA